MAVKEHESKSSIRIRNFLSFILFVMLVLLSVSCCARLSFANKDNVYKQIVSYNFVADVRSDLCGFAEGLYDEYGVPSDNVENIISYDNVSEIISSYYGFYIADYMEYSEESCENNINALCAQFDDDVEIQLKKTQLNYNSKAGKAMHDELYNYIKASVELPHINSIKSAINIGTIALYAVIGISAFFTFAVMLILFFVGTKRQRSVRAIAISFMTAGLYELVMSLIVYIISKIKTIDLFPLYFTRLFYNWLNMGIFSIICCAGVLLLISLMLCVAVWKIRKDN